MLHVQTVTVLSSEDDLSNADTTCKMLDCDTISQAKAKAIDFLYMNTPFSQRPKVKEVDLSEYIAQLRSGIFTRE